MPCRSYWFIENLSKQDELIIASDSTDSRGQSYLAMNVASENGREYIVSLKPAFGKTGKQQSEQLSRIIKEAELDKNKIIGAKSDTARHVVNY